MAMTQPFAPLRVNSPCINVCALDDANVCVGCGRHMDDIVSWTNMTPLQRHEANVRADMRRERRADRARGGWARRSMEPVQLWPWARVDGSSRWVWRNQV